METFPFMGLRRLVCSSMF